MTSRRLFLGTMLAGAVAPAFVRAQQPAPGRRIKLAVNLGMVQPKTLSVSEKFALIKQAGLDGVEVNRPDGEVTIEALQAARKETGLEIAGVICSTHWGKPLTHQDPAIREQGMRGLKLALQESGELECPRLLLVPGVVNQEVSYADAYTRSQAAIRTAIPAAEAAGVKIAVENVWNQFLLSPLEAARFVDEIASPWVGWHFDIGNIVTFGWPEQWIRTLGPRILNLHIKEFSRKKRDAEGLAKGFNAELGEGDVAWPAVVKALDEIGYKGWGIAEVPGGDLDRLKFLATRMDKILGNSPG